MYVVTTDPGDAFNWFQDVCNYDVWLLPSIHADEIHGEVFEGDFRNVGRRIESGESVNKKEPHFNFSLLHMAVLKNQLEILDYLLSREGIEVDARCSEGRTPLFVATALGHIESVEKLIRAGCDVNLSDYESCSPLHMSACCSDICHLLIRHGARVDAVNRYNKTLLHKLMDHGSLEIVHMLLYYNADVNVPDHDGVTPFMEAFRHRNVSALEALLEYVDDFDRAAYDSLWSFGSSTLKFAFESMSMEIEEIERGIEEDILEEDILEEDILEEDIFEEDILEEHIWQMYGPRRPVGLSFKSVWERLRDSVTTNTIDLLDYIWEVPKFLQVIIEGDNFEPALTFFSKGENYLLFVDKFAEKEFELEQLTCLTCRLLQCGFRPTNYDLHAIFSRYGYCQLFRILLYMDNDFTCHWQRGMAVSRFILDVDYNLENAVEEVNDISKKNVMKLLEYSICPRLMDALTINYSDDVQMSAILSKLPRVPLLLELARNAARKYIWHKLKFTNACQFYTTIDHLDMPTLYKNILTFKRKIYEVEQ